MHKSIFLCFFSVFVFNGFAQTMAYDASYNGLSNFSCVDLHFLNASVKGHQTNVSVKYFLTENDAYNNINHVPRFYNYSSSNETLFARVTHLSNSDYAVSQINIILTPLNCCPPPPPGRIIYNICDNDNDNVEIVYLENLRGLMYGYSFPEDSFCGLDDNEVTLSYYLSYNDAANNVNSIDDIYSLKQDVFFYCKLSNSIDTVTYIYEIELYLIVCAESDDDNDGVDDSEEDVNNNGSYVDDDTDKDGLSNYLDNDDDGDGILTINEDYNNNGDPTDDDTNANGIADYLEYNITLSSEDFGVAIFKLQPNPARNIVNIEFNNSMNTAQVNVFDILGNNVIYLQKETYNQSLSIDISKLPVGIYFINLKANVGHVIKKLIIK